MNTYINIQLQDFSQQVRGYNMLYNYRLMNLCVKAEPAALVPVTVEVMGAEYNLEEGAEIRRPDEYHLEIRSNNENNLSDVISAIFDVHPEFKLEVKTEKGPDDSEKKYASYTMPEVNKDRYDALTKLTKTFYDECVAKIDLTYAKQQARFVDLLLHASAEEAEEAKGSLKKARDDGKDESVEIRDTKLKEIEEAYQRYLQNNPVEEDGGPGYDVTKGMRMTEE